MDSLTACFRRLERTNTTCQFFRMKKFDSRERNPSITPRQAFGGMRFWGGGMRNIECLQSGLHEHRAVVQNAMTDWSCA